MSCFGRFFNKLLGDNPNNIPLKRKWWAFQAHRPELYQRLATMRRTLVTSQVNPRFGFAFMPADWVFSQKAVVFCIESHSGFGVIQSRVHEAWARFFSSTSIELMSYTPSDCYETFPFPEHWESNLNLEAASKAYYEFRAALMIRTGQGLTKTYNRFHDPHECDPEIEKLRQLHASMDRAVLDSYGWTDLDPKLDFVLDYENEEADESEGNDRKKPWRYRWIDEDRDKVLARLLELNRTRAEEEAQSGLASAAPKPPSKRGRKSPKMTSPIVTSLFETQEPAQ